RPSRRLGRRQPRQQRKRGETQTQRRSQRERLLDDCARRGGPWRFTQQGYGSYFNDKFFRLKARRGYQRAALAVTHKLPNAVYVMLSTGAVNRDLDDTYLDQLDERRVAANLVRGSATRSRSRHAAPPTNPRLTWQARGKSHGTA